MKITKVISPNKEHSFNNNTNLFEVKREVETITGPLVDELLESAREQREKDVRDLKGFEHNGVFVFND